MNKYNSFAMRLMKGLRLIVPVCLIVLLPRAQAVAQSWVGTWATAPEPTGKSDMPRLTSLSNSTLRQTIRVSIGGDSLRLKLSNLFSERPLAIRSVYIAEPSDSSDIAPSSARYLSFGGKRGTVIRGGESLYTDVVAYALRPLQRLSITVCYGETPASVTSHLGSRTTSYIMDGLCRPSDKFVTGEKVTHWYSVFSVEVKAAEAHSIAVLGNSITDGRGSTTDMHDRWTDRLAEAMDGRIGVLNLGIGANCVLRGGISQPAVVRFNRDILGQSGADCVVVFEGINDIGQSDSPVAPELIEAYKGFIAKARSAGKKVVGATITPFRGHEFYSEAHERDRQTVNEWIRGCRLYDAVLDFDKLLRDPGSPDRVRAEWQVDWLHPNADGYKAMGRYAAEILREL